MFPKRFFTVEPVQKRPFCALAPVRIPRLELGGFAIFVGVVEDILFVGNHEVAVFRTRDAVMFVAQVLECKRITVVNDNTTFTRVKRRRKHCSRQQCT